MESTTTKKITAKLVDLSLKSTKDGTAFDSNNASGTMILDTEEISFGVTRHLVSPYIGLTEKNEENYEKFKTKFESDYSNVLIITKNFQKQIENYYNSPYDVHKAENGIEFCTMNFQQVNFGISLATKIFNFTTDFSEILIKFDELTEANEKKEKEDAVKRNISVYQTNYLVELSPEIISGLKNIPTIIVQTNPETPDFTKYVDVSVLIYFSKDGELRQPLKLIENRIYNKGYTKRLIDVKIKMEKGFNFIANYKSAESIVKKVKKLHGEWLETIKIIETKKTAEKTALDLLKQIDDNIIIRAEKFSAKYSKNDAGYAKTNLLLVRTDVIKREHSDELYSLGYGFSFSYLGTLGKDDCLFSINQTKGHMLISDKIIFNNLLLSCMLNNNSITSDIMGLNLIKLKVEDFKKVIKLFKELVIPVELPNYTLFSYDAL